MKSSARALAGVRSARLHSPEASAMDAARAAWRTPRKLHAGAVHGARSASRDCAQRRGIRPSGPTSRKLGLASPRGIDELEPLAVLDDFVGLDAVQDRGLV